MPARTRPTHYTTYNQAHRRERQRLTPIVNAGHAYCTQPTCIEPNRWIKPGTPWDLAHNRTTGGWHGPAHARCNRSEGATHGNTHRNHRSTHTRWTSRPW